MMKIEMNKTRIILIVLVVAAIVAIIVFSNKGTIDVKGDIIYEQAAGQHCKYESKDGNLVITSQEGVTVVDKAGKEIQNITKSFSNPTVVSKGDYNLFFDRKGTNLMYYKGHSQPKTITTDHSIINAKINAVGNIAVATMETGYKGKIEVYNHKAEVIYKWQIGNSYVVDMDISSDCKRLAVALLSTEGENIGTRVVMINLDKAEIVSDETFDNNIPFQVTFTRANLALVVMDTGVYAFDKSGRHKWDYQFGDKVLESYKICENGSGAFEFHGASNNNIIELYNNSGKKCGEYVSTNSIVAIDANEHAVAATDGRFIKVMNWHGGNKAVIKSQTDLKDIVILDDSYLAAVGNNFVQAVKY